jgi:hypothetical protein
MKKARRILLMRRAFHHNNEYLNLSITNYLNGFFVGTPSRRG